MEFRDSTGQLIRTRSTPLFITPQAETDGLTEQKRELGTMKTKEFIGTCVENPFETIEILADIVENAKSISKQTFLRYAFVHPDIMRDMRNFPYDYEFYRHKNIYFYTWSEIEHFYS